MPDRMRLENGPVLLRNGWIAVGFSLIGGFLLDLATPAIHFWPATFLGLVLVLLSMWGRRPQAGLVMGLVAGAAFWMPHISWLTLYLGPIPWAALCCAMIAWMGLLGAAVAAVTRWFHPRVALSRPVESLQHALIALSVAGLWVGKELLQSSWPYGGFAWGRVATSLSSSPFAELASWVGFAALSGITVFVVAFGIQTVHSMYVRTHGFETRPKYSALVSVLAVMVLLSIIPAYHQPTTGSVRLGAVQGNSDAGIFADRQPGDILRDHIVASEQLVGKNLQLFVWPEAAVDVDPLRTAGTADALDEITREVGAPLVTGVITSRGDRYYNSSIVWQEGRGVTAQYDKRHPVPFAEYMPNRSFYRALVPDLVDLVQLDYTAGDSSSTVDVAGIVAGVSICFDIIFDELAVDMVDQDAELVLAQTNNADFGRTDESAQQLAISRLRAIEMGRSIVVISTVGRSAIILPNGRDLTAIEPFTSATMVADVPLYQSVTPAIALGWFYTLVFVVGGGAGLFGAISVRATRRYRYRQHN